MPLRYDKRRSELLLPHTAAARARSDAHTLCTETPYAAAITSGTVTSSDTETELEVSAHVASEKVELLMIESSARLNTVALKSSHVIPAMPSDTCIMSRRARVGRVECASNCQN